MAILESCCFWKNVWRGSFASAIYTLVYFGFSTLILLFYVDKEKKFLLGESEHPVGETIIEKGDVSVGTVIFNVLLLACSLLMIFASILLIHGLQSNKRQFLIPWIFLMLCDMLIELVHLVHLAYRRRVKFDPIVGFLFTMDFFVLCLNLYCLLCVISQYQEYREQRAAEPPPASPIVKFTATQKMKNSTKKSTPKHKPRRLPAASPQANSLRMTNFSTITEEEETSRHKPQAEALSPMDNNQNVCSTSNESGAASVNVPIITLDPGSVH